MITIWVKNFLTIHFSLSLNFSFGNLAGILGSMTVNHHICPQPALKLHITFRGLPSSLSFINNLGTLPR